MAAFLLTSGALMISGIAGWTAILLGGALFFAAYVTAAPASGTLKKSDIEDLDAISDASHVSWKTPTIEFTTACNVLGAPGYSWQFVASAGSSIGHKSLIFAAKTMAGAALDLIADPRLLEKAKEEHRHRLGKNIYVPDPERRPPLELARQSAEKLGKSPEPV